MPRVLAIVVALALLAGLLGASALAPGAALAAPAPPALKVGCVVSQATQDWIDRHYSVNAIAAIQRQRATLAYLVSKGWDATEITEADLTDAVALRSRFDVVVLTYQFALDPAPSRVLQDYVAAGGGLVGMLASPRVAPALEPDHTNRDVLPEHWAKYLNTNVMEWGPLSEVYQQDMVNDPTGRAAVSPWPGAPHSIVASASELLEERGYPDDPITFDDRPRGMELVSMLRGNANAKPVLTVTSTDPALLYPGTSTGYSHPGYPGLKTAGTYPACVAANYLKGRAVYFGVSPVDLLPTYWGTRSAKDERVAGALVESAVAWTGNADVHFGTVVRGGRTRGSIDVYGDGIYTRQFVGNLGNVSVTGPVATRIYNPSGRLVFNATYANKYLGAAPGEEFRYCTGYRPGTLANGYYRVETEYRSSYPAFTTTWKEIAYVRRSQGRNITTRIWGASKPAIYGAALSTTTVTPTSSAYMGFYTDKPAYVAGKVLDSRGALVVNLLSAVARPAGPHGLRWTGRTATGAVAAAGTYRIVAYASNTAGQGYYVASVRLVR